ncbi:MAG: DUF3052 domain-containing protein [Saprospiraceae bacterium]
MTPNYSKTRLLKKLGIKTQFKLRIIDEPIHYLDLLGDLPDELIFLEDGQELANFVHLFCETAESMEAYLPFLKEEIYKDGMIWVSWYKKASKIPTNLDGNRIRSFARSLGLIDAKVCSVDERWSAIKLVWRKEFR